MEKNVKTTPEIISLINKKIEENKREVDGASNDLELLLPKSKEYGQMLDITMKRMVLKDKIVFHKAVIAALTDVLQDIQR
jgi:hypothetical protein